MHFQDLNVLDNALMLIILSSGDSMDQWRPECEDNKKDIADNDDNDNRMANMDLARPERGAGRTRNE